MMRKKIKFLIPFIFLLTSNANFQGMEMIRTCCQSLMEAYRTFMSAKSENKNKLENPKSILKERKPRSPNLDKKVTFATPISEWKYLKNEKEF